MSCLKLTRVACAGDTLRVSGHVNLKPCKYMDLSTRPNAPRKGQREASIIFSVCGLLEAGIRCQPHQAPITSSDPLSLHIVLHVIEW